MKKLIFGLLLAMCVSAQAQEAVRVQTPTGRGNSYQDVSAANPLPVSSSINPFTPTGSANLSVTSSSGRVALPGSGTTALIANQTSTVAYVNFGGATVTATTANTPIQPGQTIPLANGGGTYIAAITASGVTTLSIVSGTGAPISAYGQVAVNDSIGVDSSGTITGNAQAVSASMDGYDAASVLVSGTYGGFSFNFQESPDGGTHLAPVNCGVTDAYGTRNVSSYMALDNQTVLFHCNNLNGSDTFTVTSTSAPGSGTANVDISVSGFPSVLGGTVGTILNDYDPPAQSITTADVGSSSTPGQDSVGQITGTPTAGSVAAFAISGQNAVNVQLSGTWAGTEAFEKSTDGGTTWVGFGCQVTGAVYRRASVTGNGSFLCEVGGGTNFRVRQTTKISGTVVVNPVFTSAGTIAKVANANAVFDNVSGAQMSIKAASTAPATTDTAAVITKSPVGADPCQNSSVAKLSAPINISSATTTSLVAVSGTTAVYVCGFSLTISEVITTANTLKFVYGTGAACTSPTNLTGAFGTGGITAGTPITVAAYPGHTAFSAPASNGICATTTIGASGSFQGVMTYVQQ